MIDPDSSSTSSILVFVVLLALYAFFAAAKEAIVSMRKSRRLQLGEEGNRPAQLVNDLAEDATRLLATEQLVLKFLGFSTIAFASVIYTEPLSRLLSVSNFAAVLIITLMAVFFTLILGELVPREIGRAYAEPIALVAIYPFNIISHVVTPLARLVSKIGWVISGRWDEPESYGLHTITEEDLRTYVDAGEEGGVLKEDEKEMIYSIFELDDTMAREIMVPRIDMIAVESDLPVEEALDIILEGGHSRVPVYVENIDHIIGILYAKDLLAHWRDGGDPRPVRGLERQAYYVPETKPVSDLLHELQTQKVHIAIVVDEYGGTAGLVTIEDILEEIVGEIQDEHDPEEFYMQRISDAEFIFSARMDLDDINNLMETHLPTEESDTLGGMIYTLLGRVPVIGDMIELEDLRLTVLAVEGRRIGNVKLQKIAKSERADQEQIRDEQIVANKKTPPLIGDTRNFMSESP